MTLEELWKVPINAKWAPIVIEGEKIKDKYFRQELLCRLDSSLSAWNICNERNGLRSAIKEVSDMPDIGITGKTSEYMMKDIGGDITSDRLFESAADINVKEKRIWENWFGRSSCDGDSSIFETNVNDGKCWFNPRTGSVKPTIANVGKWVRNIGELKEELEWFAKEFPMLDVYITISDEDAYGSWENKIFIVTLRINDGQIQMVPTKKYDLNKLPTFSGNKIRVAFRNFIFKFVKLYHKIQNVFDPDSACYWHNYRLLNGDYSNRLFYSDKEMIRIVNFYKDICQDRNGPFWRYLNEKMRNVEYFSLDSFIDDFSDASVNPDCGKGWFIYKNGLKIEIDFKKLYDKAQEICLDYDVDCICDLSGDKEKVAKRRLKTFIIEEYNDFENVEWEWNWNI